MGEMVETVLETIESEKGWFHESFSWRGRIALCLTLLTCQPRRYPCNWAVLDGIKKNHKRPNSWEEAETRSTAQVEILKLRLKTLLDLRTTIFWYIYSVSNVSNVVILEGRENMDPLFDSFVIFSADKEREKIYSRHCWMSWRTCSDHTLGVSDCFLQVLGQSIRVKLWSERPLHWN